MAGYLRRSWAVVDLDCVAYNIKSLKKLLAPHCMLMGVVKADAYGHGDKHAALEMARSGVDWFGVSNLDEAVSLRSHGIFQPILIFGITPPEHANALSGYNITQTVHCLSYARELNNAAAAAGVVLNVHIKLDTGMSRIGFALQNGFEDQSVSEILETAEYKNLYAQGIFTHFSCSEDESKDAVAFTKTQFARFDLAVKRLSEKGLTFAIRHCCNSAATVLYPEMHMDMVRSGILAYGLTPDAGWDDKVDIKPAMQLYSVVSMVKEIDADTPVGYSRQYRADRRTTVATVQIGYSDGFSRALSNKARVLIRGQYANVIGRICMDQMMIDVTHIEGVKAGDVVTLAGRDGEHFIGFDELAELSGTNNYERICSIGRRVPRVYLRGGKDAGTVSYIVGKPY